MSQDEDIFFDLCVICDKLILPSEEQLVFRGDGEIVVHKMCYEKIKPKLRQPPVC